MSFRYKGPGSLGIASYSMSLKQNLINYYASTSTDSFTVDVFYGNGSKNHWCSRSFIGSWLLVSFNGIKPIVTHVFIKSHDSSDYFLKSWKLSASNDKSNWDDLFDIYDSNDLANSKSKVYKLNNTLKKPYTHFKFTSTGPANKDDCMRIIKVDFYGSLYNIPNYCTPYANRKRSNFMSILLYELIVS